MSKPPSSTVSSSDLREYIAENYGTCKLGNLCICLKPNRDWLGTICPHWQPIEADSWEALQKAYK